MPWERQTIEKIALAYGRIVKTPESSGEDPLEAAQSVLAAVERTDLPSEHHADLDTVVDASEINEEVRAAIKRLFNAALDHENLDVTAPMPKGSE